MTPSHDNGVSKCTDSSSRSDVTKKKKILYIPKHGVNNDHIVHINIYAVYSTCIYSYDQMFACPLNPFTKKKMLRMSSPVLQVVKWCRAYTIPEGRREVLRVVPKGPADASREIFLSVEGQAVRELEEELVGAVPRTDHPLAHRQRLGDRRAEYLAHLDG